MNSDWEETGDWNSGMVTRVCRRFVKETLGST